MKKHSLLSTQFVDSVFTPLSLVLISVIAIVAVAVALFQVNKGPVAPTAPQTSQAADFSSNTCALNFVVPGPVADLELHKTISDSTPIVGQQVTFTLSVFNAGPSLATGVTVRDQLPASLTHVSSTPAGAYDPTTGIWTVGTISVNQTVTLNIVATVNSTAETQNYAEIRTSDQTDPDSTPDDHSTDDDDDDSVTINPTTPGADLDLVKRSSSLTPTQGDTITFTLDLHNSGPDNATNVTVEEKLASAFTYLSSTATQGSYDATTGIWTVGTVSADATVSLTVTVKVTGTGTVANYVQVKTSDQPDPDSTPDDDSTDDDDDDTSVIEIRPPEPTSTPVASADLSLTKYLSNSTPKVGENVTYTVTVYNGGPSDATNVTVYEPLVGGTTFVSATASQGSYNVSTGVWTVGTIPANQSRKLDIVVTVNVAGALTNTAEVSHSDQNDPDSTPNNHNSNEDDQASATVNPEKQGSDLSLIKRASLSTPVVGQNVTYTIEVHNAGPQQAENVKVYEPVPANTTLIDVQPSQGSYDRGPGIWTVGTLTRDSTAIMLMTVRIDKASQLANTAEVVSSSQPDPDSTPNNHNPNEDDQDDAVINPQGPAALPKAGNASNTTLFVIATGVIVLIIGAMGLLLLL